MLRAEAMVALGLLVSDVIMTGVIALVPWKCISKNIWHRKDLKEIFILLEVSISFCSSSVSVDENQIILVNLQASNSKKKTTWMVETESSVY